QAVLAERAHAGDPSVVLLVELDESSRCGLGPDPGEVVGRRAAEVGRVAGAEHTDEQVPDAPRDGGDRRGIWFGHLEVDHQVATTGSHGRGGLGPRPDAPGAWRRLPQVLVV